MRKFWISLLILIDMNIYFFFQLYASKMLYKTKSLTSEIKEFNLLEIINFRC